jgi:tetratricopeptide (TPR) repeat protein
MTIPGVPRARSGKVRFCAVILTASLLTAVTPSPGKSATQAPGIAALNAADNAYMTLQYSHADSLYKAMLDTTPDNTDLYWKLSRLNICIAESIKPEETARRMPYYTKAVEYARKAVAIDSNSAAGHTWLAAALAVKSDKIGNKEKLKRAREIKRELDKAISLNPNDDVAWSILGSYHRQISHIGWFSKFIGNTFVGEMPEGNAEMAEKAFRKAISLNPRAIRHYHELALLYIDLDRKPEAVRILKTALNKPVLMKSDIRRIDEIRQLIRKLEE